MYLAIFILHTEVYLGLCYAFKVEIFLQKWLTTLSQEIFSQKALSQMHMFVVTEFFHSFHKNI